MMSPGGARAGRGPAVGEPTAKHARPRQRERGAADCGRGGPPCLADAHDLLSQVGHVAAGVKWFTYLAEQKGCGRRCVCLPSSSRVCRAEPRAVFHEMVKQYMPTGLVPPFNTLARTAANFGSQSSRLTFLRASLPLCRVRRGLVRADGVPSYHAGVSAAAQASGQRSGHIRNIAEEAFFSSFRTLITN
jgi:hypothetical protein